MGGQEVFAPPNATSAESGANLATKISKRCPWRAGHAIRSCLCSPNTVFNVQILATFGTRFLMRDGGPGSFDGGPGIFDGGPGSFDGGPGSFDGGPRIFQGRREFDKKSDVPKCPKGLPKGPLMEAQRDQNHTKIVRGGALGGSWEASAK